MLPKNVIPFIFPFLLFSSFASGKEIVWGQVCRVMDGDSLQVRSNGRIHEIRLYGIDAPEYRQKGSLQSKRWLQGFLLGKSVAIEKVDRDQYNRLVAVVSKDGKIVNEMLVREGMAWVYSRYCHRRICRDWKRAEKRAKQERRGIWREKHPIPPWVWRHRGE